MKPPSQPMPPAADLLSIPDFLKRDGTPSPRRRTNTASPTPKPRPLPPESMMPVLRAIRRGKDTLQKLRATLGNRYSDRELRAGIDALLRIGSIHKTGRRYRPIHLRQPPPKEKRP